jgi:hypothetical protein
VTPARTGTYVKTGPAMHGDWLDPDDVPLFNIRDACEAIRDELADAADAETAAADHAADNGNYRAAWFTLARAQELHRLSNDFAWTQRVRAPRYRDDEAALERLMRDLIVRCFPLGLDYNYGGPSERWLYVWETEVDESAVGDEPDVP